MNNTTPPIKNHNTDRVFFIENTEEGPQRSGEGHPHTEERMAHKAYKGAGNHSDSPPGIETTETPDKDRIQE